MSATLLYAISVSNPGYSGLLLEVYTRTSVSNKVYEVLPPALYPICQSVTWGIHLECIDKPILVSDKVYEDLSATLFPGVSVSNPGYNNSLSTEKNIAYRYSLVYTLGDRPLYTGLLTDIPGSSVAYRSSYTLSLTDIPAYTPSDRPLYPRLQTNILGNSVADRY